jgi:hypothetical protein
VGGLIVRYLVRYLPPYADRDWDGTADDEADAETYGAERLMDEEHLTFEQAAAYVLPAEPVMRHAQR